MKKYIISFAAFALLALVSGTNVLARSPSSSVAGITHRAGQFDYYVLALSWSPSYCLSHPEDRAQCSGKGYGFVLHGLWPQYRAGGYPSKCETKETLTDDAMALGSTIFPSPKLMEHEWSKHGTCSGVSAVEYFKTSDKALGQVKVPESLQAPQQTFSMTAQEIIDTFTKANPGMPSGGIVVACGGPELSEVRVCLDRNLTMAACGKGVKTSCRSGPVRIRSVR